MRLKVLLARIPRHSECVCGVGWSHSDEVVSCGDDQKLLRWNLINLEAAPLAEIPEGLFATSFHFYPRSLAKQNDVFAVTSSDGKMYIMSRNGKVEKVVDAHRGAALCVRWSPDGTGILTCGEEGAVKMWSRQGLLRSVLTQLSTPCYACAWNGTSSKVIYTCGEDAYIKSLKTQVPPIKWKAHDGIVLCADWNGASDLIITGGEDCKFKVWDSFGRVLFSSAVHANPITSLAFSPDGSLFAVGSFNLLRLCDKAGWAHSLDILSTGSLMTICWSPDGTQLAAGCAGGHVVHAHLVDKRVSYRNLEVVQTQRNVVEVRDVSSEVAKERLETKERITRITLGFDHLIVITTKQAYIYNSSNWNTPHIIDLKEAAVYMIVQSDKLFLLADGAGLYVYNYEGRLLSELKLPGGGGGGSFNERTTAMSADTVAVGDRIDGRVIHFLDPTTNKTQGDGKYTHTNDIDEIRLSQSGNLNTRLFAFIDDSGAVLIGMVKTYGKVSRTAKIGSLIQTIAFHDELPMLAGLQENSLIVWPFPVVAFEDRELLDRTIMEKKVDGLGKFPEMLNFTRNSVLLRRSDGSLIPTAISPFPAALYSHFEASKWDQAIRLCRQINDDHLWSMLAGMAISANNLYAGEIAFGALNEIEKVELLRSTRNEKDNNVKSAMMCIVSGKIGDADVTLEKHGHIFKDIMLNLTSFRWERALEVAVKHKQFLEVVMGYRQRYLKELGKTENNEKFLRHMSDVEIDWTHIRQVIAAEREREAN